MGEHGFSFCVMGYVAASDEGARGARGACPPNPERSTATAGVSRKLVEAHEVRVASEGGVVEDCARQWCSRRGMRIGFPAGSTLPIQKDARVLMCIVEQTCGECGESSNPTRGDPSFLHIGE